MDVSYFEKESRSKSINQLIRKPLHQIVIGSSLDLQRLFLNAPSELWYELVGAINLSGLTNPLNTMAQFIEEVLDKKAFYYEQIYPIGIKARTIRCNCHTSKSIWEIISHS